MLQSVLSPDEYQFILRRDFTSFIERSFYELNPQTRLLLGAHVEVIATKLEACRQGRIKRLIINLPPRHLKSHCASIAYVAWYLGHHPAGHVICASYGQDLADKLARDCRTVMMSAWYKQLFPTRLAERIAVHDFMTTDPGTRMSTSVGGVLTGRGADLIIIDDALRERMGEYNFSSQYQQNPIPLGGAMVKTGWLRYYEVGELPERFDTKIQSWDTANKSTELSDYSVCTTWGRANGRLYLLHVFRQRLNYPDLKRKVKELADLHGVHRVLIEDKASGTQLIQDLQAEHVFGIIPYEPPSGTDKIMRLS